MTFQCVGTAYCLDGDLAVIMIKSNNKTDNLEIQNVPICIVTQPTSSSSAKCWKFTGRDINNINSFEFFGCGMNPSFVNVGDGLGLYIDGVRLGGETYRYSFASAVVAEVTQVIRSNNVYQSDGDCTDCLNNVKVIITNRANKQVYTKIFSSEPIIKVGCNGCPAGFIKCNHNAYPGYCCIPCKETGDRLKNLANKVGR